MTNNKTEGVWRIEYDNDSGPSDESFWQWWTVTNDEKNFDCKTEADAKWLLDRLSPPAGVEQRAKGGIWVKASERLPEVDTSYNLRIDGRPGFGKWYGVDRGFGFEATNGFGTLYQDQFHLIEWLDLTQSIAGSESQGRQAVEHIKLIAECAFNSVGTIEGAEGFEAWWQDELRMNQWLKDMNTASPE